MNKLIKSPICILIAFLMSGCGQHVHTFDKLEFVDNYTHDQVCSSCGEHVSKEHTFDQCVISSKFLKKQRSCYEYAQYYKSCKCGASSENSGRFAVVFEDIQGGKAEHDLTFHPQVNPSDGHDGYEAYYNCSVCHSLFDCNMQPISEVKIIKSDIPFFFNEKFNGKEVDVISKDARDYLTADNVAKYLYNAEVGKSKVSGITFAWTDNGAAKPFKLEIATDSNYTNVYRTYTGIGLTSLRTYNLLPGMNYIKLSDANEKFLTDSILIKEPVREIFTNDGIHNMRDLGGWSLPNNHKIKYGMIYRSAGWSTASVAKTYLDELHMKTELDIRLSEGGKDYSHSECPLEGIGFYNYGITQYDQILADNQTVKNNIKSVFDLLANEESYPLTYHCTWGSDRTGTLSFLIGGILGMSYDDLARDFELTSFFYGKRWRSKINVNGDDYSFDSSGVMQNDSANYVAFDLLVHKIIESSAISIEAGVKKFLNNAGVSDQTINDVKNILVA